MTTMLALTKQQGLRVCGWLAACALAAGAISAQTQAPSPRIRSEISVSDVTPVKNSPRPFADPRFDVGRMPADARLTGITLVFNRTAAQQADLQALLAAQQNPASPLFHKWLTPEQFGARFGMAQADLDKVEQWLQQQGFTIDEVGRAHGFIRFSGTANQVELAFQTQMHYYKGLEGVQHFSPSGPPTIPSAIAPVVETIRDLADLKPRSSHVPASRLPHPEYTFYGSNNQQYVLFAPGDIKVAYDINPLITGGYTGTGQTIAVMGQSEISATDITNFQDAAGLTEKTPNMILVPGTGSAAFSAGDEGESDLDVEWAGAIAPGAAIDFVYAGATSSGGVFDSLQYAIDSKLGTIITVSYGICEPLLGGSTLDTVLQEAQSQGQTVIASSGDYGSTTCWNQTSNTSTEWELAVSYPASSEYVTGVGGTEVSAADDVVGTYWGSAPTTGNEVALTTALSYIPEVAWNDDVQSGQSSPSQNGGLSAGGGGKSILYTSKPSWQTRVTGIPADNARYVPDVALYSSPDLPGYLYCTSDQSDWVQGQTGSCGSSQFFDSSLGYFTIAGGTSFAAPIFAGMVAIVNQKAGYNAGQGLLNPTLYTLASNPTTYASAFHDVTSGNNYCTAGTTYGYCSASGATEGYVAGTGYDLVTGLGSVDLNNLTVGWPASTSTLIGTMTGLSAATNSPTVNTPDNVTITVSSDDGTTVPTGTVSVSVNGAAATTYTLTSNGTYVDALTFTAAGSYSIVAQYSGDATHAASTGALTVTVGGTSSGSGTFTLTATNISVSQGSSGGSTVTVTPAGGYTGTVTFQLSTSSSDLQTYGCYDVTNAVVSGTSAAKTTVTVYTSATQCASIELAKRQTLHRFAGAGGVAASHQLLAPRGKTLPIGLAALASFLLLGLRRRTKWITILGCLLLLAGAGLAIGCGGGGNGGKTNNNYVPKGTYTLGVVGTDSLYSNITATTSFTLTVN